MAILEDGDTDEILVGDLIMVEVLQGARNEAHAAFIKRRLRTFRIEAMLNPDMAAMVARNDRLLRQRGVTLRKTADLLIATFCMERDHALLHDDRDFHIVAQHLPLVVV